MRYKICPDIVDFPASTCPIKTTLMCVAWIGLWRVRDGIFSATFAGCVFVTDFSFFASGTDVSVAFAGAVTSSSGPVLGQGAPLRSFPQRPRRSLPC